MKKTGLILSISLILVSFKTGIGQVFRGYNPDTVVMVNEQLIYPADFTGNPDNPGSYTLLVARPGMTINPASGVITWTPVNVADGGKVVVMATNSIASNTDTFLIFVSGKYECLTGAAAYWNFDALKGSSYYQDYVDTHNATSSAPHPVSSAGKVDNAILVTAADQGLVVPDHNDFHFGTNQSFSISFWFKSNIGDRSNVGVIIGRDEGTGYEKRHWWIGLDEDNRLFFLVRDNNYYDDLIFMDSVVHAHLYGDRFYNDFDWHHIVCVRDAAAGKLKVYYDFDGTTPLTGNAIADYPGSSDFFGSTTTANLNIGFLSNDVPMDGTLDELLIFRKALSESEISNLFSKGNAGNPACDAGNYAPIFTSNPDTIAFEDQLYSYQMIAKDIDVGDNLDYSPVNLPGWLSYNASTHVISGTPVNSDVGKVTVRVKVSDGTAEVFQQFNLNIKNVNDPPVISSSAVLLVNEEQVYTYDVNATDVDAGDVLTYSLTVKPAWLSINSSTGLITGTAPVNDTGSYSVTVRATDVALAFAEQSFTLDIRNVNDPPVITGQNPVQVDEDNSLLIQLSDILYTDPDNPANDITITVLSGTNYTFTGNTITPALNFNGTLTVNLRISDLISNTTGTVSVTVNPVNDVPVIVSLPDAIAIEGQSYSYVFNATDADGDVLTYTVPMLPSWLTYLSAGRILSGTPGFSHVGTDTIQLSVTDGTAITSTKVALTVITGNHIPVITSLPLTAISEDQQYIYSILFSDADAGDVVTLSAVILPQWLNLNIAQATLTGTPTNDQVGMNATAAFQVKLKVSDGKQDSTQTFTITVTNVNDAPEILGQKDTLIASPGSSVVLNLNNINVEDVDDITDSLVLTVLPGTNYTIAGNTVAINEGVGLGLFPINIRVSDPAGAKDESVYSCKILATGIKDLTNSSSLVSNIYPLPASQYVVFEFAPSNAISLQIFDISGKLVIERQINNNENTVQVNTSYLSSGFYLYKAYSGNSYQVGKISVKH